MSLWFEIAVCVFLSAISAGVWSIAFELARMYRVMEEDAGLDAFNEAMTSAPVEKPKRPGPRVGFGRE
jgi:tellurite resistance protein